MNVEDGTERACALDADERFALMQLCSTAYLALARLDDAACARLSRAGLAVKGTDGFWSATPGGRALFKCLEKELGGNGLRCPDTA